MSEISVIVPVYNVESFLSKCIDSILQQTFRDFEVILVDDGSTDKSSLLCDEYSKKDARVFTIHQSNKGLSSARNAGLDWVFSYSDCKWITFIDSDDWVCPSYLESLYKAGIETSTGLVISNFCETGDRELVLDSYELHYDVWKTEEYQLSNYINAHIAWGKLYSRSDFDETRYPVGKIHEDEFTTYKILYLHNCVTVINNQLYYYYANEKGITKSSWRPERLAIIDALHEKSIFYKERNNQALYIDNLKRLFSMIWYYLNEFKYNDIQLEKECKKKLKRLYLKEYKLFHKDLPNDYLGIVRINCIRLKCSAFDRALKFY